MRRVRESLKVQEEKKQKEKAKLAAYLALTDEVLSKVCFPYNYRRETDLKHTQKKSNDWSGEAFELTSRLLNINPEFYTIWNYRRNILTRGIFPSRSLCMIPLRGNYSRDIFSSPAEINGILSNDLDMTTTALKAHPKVYWIWNHRRWCLENIPDGGNNNDEHGWRKASWERELFIVEKMLDADARNCMYRHLVQPELIRPSPQSLHGATDATFLRACPFEDQRSSSLHQPLARSKLISQTLAHGTREPKSSRPYGIVASLINIRPSSKVVSCCAITDALLNNTFSEFDLVQNAMYTDPNDQSVWLYHRWLIGSGRLVPCCPSHHTRASFDTLIGTGDDYKLLEREIVVIQELLDEQPDSKCEYLRLVPASSLYNGLFRVHGYPRLLQATSIAQASCPHRAIRGKGPCSTMHRSSAAIGISRPFSTPKVSGAWSVLFAAIYFLSSTNERLPAAELSR